MTKVGIIMAGGDGQRFWPNSRKKKPKQFLKLINEKTLLDQTFRRLSKFINPENIYVITSEPQVEVTIESSEFFNSKEKIIVEPTARNTAACIGLATVFVQNRFDDAVMFITPADSYITDMNTYSITANQAIEEAALTDSIVILGIKPSYPSTDYGYIEVDSDASNVMDVVSFREKPNQQTATEFILTNKFYWNSGVFVAKSSVMEREFKNYLPDTWEILSKISPLLREKQPDLEEFKSLYNRIEKISIDYGLIEKVHNLKMIKGTFGWSDLGSWQSLRDYHNLDTNENIKVGPTFGMDVSNSIFVSESKPIIGLGLKDVLVVNEKDLVFVCGLKHIGKIKEMLAELQKNGFEDLI